MEEKTLISMIVKSGLLVCVIKFWTCLMKIRGL